MFKLRQKKKKKKRDKLSDGQCSENMAAIEQRMWQPIA